MLIAIVALLTAEYAASCLMYLECEHNWSISKNDISISV